MKRSYEKPEMDIYFFKSEDIITLSFSPVSEEVEVKKQLYY